MALGFSCAIRLTCCHLFFTPFHSTVSAMHYLLIIGDWWCDCLLPRSHCGQHPIPASSNWDLDAEVASGIPGNVSGNSVAFSSKLHPTTYRHLSTFDRREKLSNVVTLTSLQNSSAEWSKFRIFLRHVPDLFGNEKSWRGKLRYQHRIFQRRQPLTTWQ